MVKLFLFLLLCLQSLTAQAVVISSSNAGSTPSEDDAVFYFPVTATDADNSTCATALTYPTTLQKVDPTTGAFYFYVTPTSSLTDINGGTFPTTDSTLVVKAQYNGNDIDVVSADAAYLYATGTKEIEYKRTEGRAAHIGINLADIVAASGEGFCSRIGVTDCQYDPATGSATYDVNIGVIRKSGNFTTTSDADYTTIQIRIANCPPKKALDNTVGNHKPSILFNLAPGDERIHASVSSNAPLDTVPLTKLVAFVDKSSKTTTPGINSVIKSEFESAGGGDHYISGLANDTEYCVSLGYVNAAGLISELPNAGTGPTNCITPTQIDGFLNKSTCFVASAAYGSYLNPKLGMLRLFRDEVLLSSSAGRAFVSWYYSWSPKAARTILEYENLKPVVRALLFPLVVVAEAILLLKDEPFVLIGIISVLLLALVYFFRRSKLFWVSSLFLVALFFAANAHAETSHDPNEVQPYIESLKAGRELQPQYNKAVRQAAGFSIVTGNVFNLNSTKSQANGFNSVYSTKEKYQLGFGTFYEYQLIREAAVGAFGPMVSMNVLYLKGKGVFTKTGTVSDDTKFTFVSVPFSLGASYRFILPKIIVPFAQLGAAGIPMMESRDDGKPSRRAFSAGVNAVLGASLNLDWIHRKSAWEQYSSNNILHSYLVFQRQQIRSIIGQVSFNYIAYYAGLSFEF